MKSIATSAILATALSAGTAFAADLPSRKSPAPSIIEATPVSSWSGVYLGVTAGGFANNSNLITGVGYATENDGGSLLAGATVGYNWQFDNGFVVGAEADGGYRGKGGISTQFSTRAADNDGYFGTMRARGGFGWDRTLVYATAGVAYGNKIAPGTLTIPSAGYSGVQSLNNGGAMVGWTAGAGVEFKLTDDWSVKGEYLYAGLGRKTLVYLVPGTNVVSGLVPTQIGMHVMRLGVNYRFNWDNRLPVVAARY